MFLIRPQFTVRPATPDDQNAVTALIHFEERVHAHLEWQNAEAWLGRQPFLLAEMGDQPVGALACPPAPPDTAWIRLLALHDDYSADDLWQGLWPQAKTMLAALGVKCIAGLMLDDWIEPLYRAARFKNTHAVIVLSRAVQTPLAPQVDCPAHIRPSQPDDEAAIIATDTAAFVSPWQIAPDMIRQALAQANWVTVAEVNGQMVGYQLTTPGQRGAHLARLAVRPEWRGQGIGTALAADLVRHYQQSDIHQLTVNTQDDNTASLRAYQRIGFRPNGERFPVYQLAL